MRVRATGVNAGLTGEAVDGSSGMKVVLLLSLLVLGEAFEMKALLLSLLMGFIRVDNREYYHLLSLIHRVLCWFKRVDIIDNGQLMVDNRDNNQ